jgi:hypothetical protein
MILDYKINIIVKQPKDFQKKGYNVKKGDVLYLSVQELSKGSHILVNYMCDYCGEKSQKEYRYLHNLKKHNCNNKKCIKERIKETNLEKYGVVNVFESEKIKEKIKETNLEKYGVESYTKSIFFNKSVIETNLEKYGVEHFFQSNIFKKLTKETNLEKYGVEHHSKSIFFNKKVIKTNLNKYGVNYPLQSNLILSNLISHNIEKYGVGNVFQTNEVKIKIKKSNLKKYKTDNYNKSEYKHLNTILGKDYNYIKYIGNEFSMFNCNKGHTFEISSYNYHGRIKNNIPLCTICNPIGDSKSIKEKELLEFIKSIYFGEVISSYRDGLEIDIYLPELNIGFEFNGLYWHSEKFKENNYHLNKTNYFKEKGIRIINIWEDDYNLRRIIIESQIKNLLGINIEKIFARKCQVKLVDIKDSKKFLDDNHIQGLVSSKIKLGLYFEGELVSLMTFDHNEGRKKMGQGGWNLNRFCNKLNTNVVGGASKLLSYFIKNYDVKRIVSYADKDWSVGNLYYTLGFTNVGGNGPDYKYIVDGKRVHKSRYRKSKLKTELTESKQMELNGINKIYDCGKLKFEKLIYT